MAGPEEKRLAKAQSASPEAIRASADSWRAAADGLAEVSDALRNAKVRIRESWSGPSAEDAEAAFDSLASSVDRHQETMRHAVRSLDTAAGGLDQAKQEYTSLPPVLPMPTAPDLTGPTDRQSVETEMRYIRLVSAHRQSADARETKAATANAALERDLVEASQEMGMVTPKPTVDRFGRAGMGDGGRGGDAGPRSAGQGGHSVGEPFSSPYASGSGGTYVSAIGGVAGGGLAAAAGRSASRPGTLGAGVQADGPVDGVVGGGAGVAGAVGSAGGSGADAASGTSTGGAVGGAVGAAGGAAGLRGALGGLKAGTAAPSGAPAQLGRTAGGRLGTSGVIGSSS
ncbi:MAG TPA: WXG100 family type VII secretion target, partial [Nocardioidaceae bacterium]|nr:WXG100 family type VII secretion target [Nocardioidaceae bacterium]